MQTQEQQIDKTRKSPQHTRVNTVTIQKKKKVYRNVEEEKNVSTVFKYQKDCQMMLWGLISLCVIPGSKERGIL